MINQYINFNVSNKKYIIKKTIFLFLFINIIGFSAFSQSNTSCEIAEPFCSGVVYTFPMQTNSGPQLGPNYGCLYTQPNQHWYYLLVANPGDFEIMISSNPPVNVNFAAWGPYTSPTAPCTAQLTASCSYCPDNTLDTNFYPSGNLVDCSYDTSCVEYLHINNTLAGQYYIFMVSNYSNVNSNLMMQQTNFGQSGSGASICTCCLCDIFSLSSTTSACNPFTNNFSITGNVNYGFATFLDSIIVVDSITGFADTLISIGSNTVHSFLINNIPADGLLHKITAKCTGNTSGNYSIYVQSPLPCNECNADAGHDTVVCGNSVTLNANEIPGDFNTHWIANQNGIFSDIQQPNCTYTINSYGEHFLIWCVTNGNGLSCCDTVNILFISEEMPYLFISGDTLFSSADNGNIWYNQNGIISGVDTNFIYPVTYDSYYVVVINTCVHDTSDLFEYTGLIEQKLTNTVSILQLNETLIYIESNELISDIFVFDIQGKMVYSASPKGYEYLINTEKIRNGLYLFKIQTLKEIYIQKFWLR